MEELQHQRIHELCAQLKLETMAQRYPDVAAKAVAHQLTLADFFEQLLKTLTAALLDRLLHHAHVIQMKGESFRLKDKRKAALVSSRLPPQENSVAHFSVAV